MLYEEATANGMTGKLCHRPLVLKAPAVVALETHPTGDVLKQRPAG